MSSQIGSFNNKPTITLEPESKYPFTFGAAKARMIVANLDAIKAFAAANQKPGQTTAPVNGNTVAK